MSSILPRITARVDVDTQDLLTKAAAIAGMTSINSFVLNAAIEKAKQIIEREQNLKLSQQVKKTTPGHSFWKMMKTIHLSSAFTPSP